MNGADKSPCESGGSSSSARLFQFIGTTKKKVKWAWLSSDSVRAFRDYFAELSKPAERERTVHFHEAIKIALEEEWAPPKKMLRSHGRRKFHFANTTYLKDSTDVLFDLETKLKIGYYDPGDKCVRPLLHFRPFLFLLHQKTFPFPTCYFLSPSVPYGSTRKEHGAKRFMCLASVGEEMTNLAGI
jgi:hypothetical protein